MKKQFIIAFPFQTSAMVGEMSMRTCGSNLAIEMHVDADHDIAKVTILFEKQRAFRKRAEAYCTEWHVKDVYDSVCLITDSDWIAELKEACPTHFRDAWVMNHFMTYIDGYGCIEVIAESFCIKNADDVDFENT